MPWISRLLQRLAGDNRPDPAWRSSGYHYTHHGFDPQLRSRTAAKRRREAEFRSNAAKVASSSSLDRPALRAVGGVR